MSRSLLYYDAQCGFCVGTARWLHRLDILRSLEFRASLDYEAQQAGLDQDHLDQAACLVTPVGIAHQGFYAFRRLALLLPLLWPLAPIMWMPGVGFLGARIYRWIADHRGLISGCRCWSIQ
jgi:predicted DCC family thiol-disulfide oxidoreductase YuxK